MNSKAVRSLRVVVIAALAAGCGPETAGPVPGPDPAPSPARLRVVSLPPADTIEALPASGLVLEATDAAGAPVSASIQVQAEDSTAGSPDVVFADRLNGAYGGTLTLTTGAAGLATAFAKYGLRVGQVRAIARLVGSSTGERVTLTVQPGRPAMLVRTPDDTALILGRSLTPFAVDREGNPRNDAVAITTGLPLSTAGGSVTGTSYGRGQFTAQLGGLVQTTNVSVVPDGVLAVTVNPDVVLVRTDGSEYRRLSENGGLWIAWSPDGTELAFESDKIRVVDLNGNERLASAVNSGYSAEWAPQYSPDGQHIYFTVVDGNDYRVMRVRRNGQDIEIVPGMAAVWALEPAVSPNGILVYRGQNGLARRTLSTGATTDLGFDGFSPRFSPDGMRIAYAHGVTRALWVMQADGTGQTAITDEGEFAYSLDWSPDQRWLVAGFVGRPGFPLPTPGVEIVEVATGLRLPLPFARSGSGVAWKPR